MSIRQIIKYPDQFLSNKAKPVNKIDINLLKILDDLADTMYEANGMGIAAPQVGILKRIIIVNVDDSHGLLELINPEIEWKYGSSLGWEGCLSVPYRNAVVKRAEIIRLKALDRYGNVINLKCNGLLSRCIQHEIDHLNGVLFIDIAINKHTYETSSPFVHLLSNKAP